MYEKHKVKPYLSRKVVDVIVTQQQTTNKVRLDSDPLDEKKNDANHSSDHSMIT